MNCIAELMGIFAMQWEDSVPPPAKAGKRQTAGAFGAGRSLPFSYPCFLDVLVLKAEFCRSPSFSWLSPARAARYARLSLGLRGFGPIPFWVLLCLQMGLGLEVTSGQAVRNKTSHFPEGNLSCD